MRLEQPTVRKLKKLGKKKKFICFGVGQLFFNFFYDHSNKDLLEYIDYAVDNSVSDTPREISVGDRKILVKSPNYLKQFDKRNNIIFITTGKYNEVFAQVQNLTANADIVVYHLPDRYYSLSILLEKIYKILPLKNYIVLRGPNDTCDNTEALGEYIRRNNYFNQKYRLVWLCDSNKNQYPSCEKVIYNGAPSKAIGFKNLFLYYKYYGRARYLIYENQHLKKMRDDQIMIYLNHGSPPLKATKGIINLPSTLNYAISPSGFSTNIISEQYGVNEERVLVCGSPRTDIFFEKGREDVGLFNEFQLKNYRHSILWAPTFRQREGTARVDSDIVYEYGLPLVHTQENLMELNRTLKEKKILMIVKPHLLQNQSVYKIGSLTNIKVLMPQTLTLMKSNVYELMLCMDALITDYSTIAFDYMLLNRPIAYTIDDFDKYKLGFSVSDVFSLMPGNKMDKFSDLIAFIEMVDKDEDLYGEERNKVNRLIHNDLGGNNSKKLCDYLQIKC